MGVPIFFPPIAINFTLHYKVSSNCNYWNESYLLAKVDNDSVALFFMHLQSACLFSCLTGHNFNNSYGEYLSSFSFFTSLHILIDCYKSFRSRKFAKVLLDPRTRLRRVWAIDEVCSLSFLSCFWKRDSCINRQPPYNSRQPSIPNNIWSCQKFLIKLNKHLYDLFGVVKKFLIVLNHI